MTLPIWFNVVLGAIIAAAQTPAVGAALGPYAWILSGIGAIGNIFFHATGPSAPPPTPPALK